MSAPETPKIYRFPGTCFCKIRLAKSLRPVLQCAGMARLLRALEFAIRVPFVVDIYLAPHTDAQQGRSGCSDYFQAVTRIAPGKRGAPATLLCYEPVIRLHPGVLKGDSAGLVHELAHAVLYLTKPELLEARDAWEGGPHDARSHDALWGAAYSFCYNLMTGAFPSGSVEVGRLRALYPDGRVWELGVGSACL